MCPYNTAENGSSCRSNLKTTNFEFELNKYQPQHKMFSAITRTIAWLILTSFLFNWGWWSIIILIIQFISLIDAIQKYSSNPNRHQYIYNVNREFVQKKWIAAIIVPLIMFSIFHGWYIWIALMISTFIIVNAIEASFVYNKRVFNNQNQYDQNIENQKQYTLNKPLVGGTIGASSKNMQEPEKYPSREQTYNPDFNQEKQIKLETETIGKFKYCPVCGTKNEIAANFCGGCGEQFN